MSFGTFFTLSFSLCVIFVSRIAFSTLIGYYADRFIGTSPWFMLFFIGLGGYLGWLALVKKSCISKEPDA